jgi:hypothetical protein
MVLRDADPRVIITFLPPPDPQRSKPPALDLSKPDDCHIEEAIAFRSSSPDEKVAILTHDTGPILTARHLGLDFVEIPDGWLLEPEKDERQKQIDDLTRQIKELQQQYPQLSIRATDKQGSTIGALALLITEYKPPSRVQIETVLDELHNFYPVQEAFGKPPPEERLLAIGMPLGKYQPPNAEEIQRYRESYEKWSRSAREFLETLPQRLSSEATMLDAAFWLNNVGTSPANSVLVEFRATPGFLIRPSPRDEDKKVSNQQVNRLPQPPEPPRGKYIDPFTALADLSRTFGTLHSALAVPSIAPYLGRTVFDDPNAFYYRERSPPNFVEEFSLTCRQFRHQLEHKQFELQVRWDKDMRRRSGAIKCRVSAENLRSPIECILPVSVQYQRGDTASVIESYRPRPSRFRFGRAGPSRGAGVT